MNGNNGTLWVLLGIVTGVLLERHVRARRYAWAQVLPGLRKRFTPEGPDFSPVVPQVVEPAEVEAPLWMY